MEIFYTFPNTHTAILAEKVLMHAGFSVKVRPVPSAISAGCGICLCISSKFHEPARTEMKNHSATYSAVYLFEKDKFTLLEELLENT